MAVYCLSKTQLAMLGEFSGAGLVSLMEVAATDEALWTSRNLISLLG